MNMQAKPTTLRDNTEWQISWLHAARATGLLCKRRLAREFDRHCELDSSERWSKTNRKGVRLGETHCGRLLGENRDRGDVAPNPREFNIAFALVDDDGRLTIDLYRNGEQRMPRVFPMDCNPSARLEFADKAAQFQALLASNGDLQEVGSDLASLILGLVAGRQES